MEEYKDWMMSSSPKKIKKKSRVILRVKKLVGDETPENNISSSDLQKNQLQGHSSDCKNNLSEERRLSLTLNKYPKEDHIGGCKLQIYDIANQFYSIPILIQILVEDSDK